MVGKSVLFFGDINVDNVFLLPGIPEPGRDAYASHTEMHLGGAVCNSAVVMHRLGQPAAVIAAVGDDLWSDFVFKKLRQGGVNGQSIVIKTGQKTGLIFIAVIPNGERTMFSYRGANLSIQPGDLSPDLLEEVSLVQFSGYAFLESPQSDTAWHLLEMASASGIPISMDTGLDPVVLQPETIRKVLPHLSILITGDREAELLTGFSDFSDQLEGLMAYGLDQVAIKLGARGALLGWDQGSVQVNAYPVSVVDTTSAGDAFSAGLIYGYLHGFSPEAGLTLANTLGGLATTVYGAAWIGRPEVLAFLDERRQSPIGDQEKTSIDQIMHRLAEGV